MASKYFKIPVHGGPAEDELNAFLNTHRIIREDRHLIPDGPNTFWAVCVDYVGTGRKELAGFTIKYGMPRICN